MVTNQQSIQAQVNEVTQFATWLAGAMFLLWVGKTVGGMEKNFVNDVLDIATPESIPVRIPQTKVVTVTRSEALRRHVEKEHMPKVGLHPQALMIEGGELVPDKYKWLIPFIGDEPLPPEANMLLPAVDVAEDERKIDAVLKRLAEGVEGIQDSTQFRLFLVTMAKFHTYSYSNQILIMLQKPNATHVAGFVTWKDLGRWVKAGEKGIAILAPIFPPRAICPKCGSRLPKDAQHCPKCGEPVEVEIEVSPRYFTVVNVFDISQTDGKPLPEFEVPVLTGAVNEELFSNLQALMKRRGVPVSFESRPHLDLGIKGQYSPASGIWVRPEEPRAQQLKTLTHEIAHYYSEGVFRIPRQDAETIAESAAYVVGAHYGFDTGVRSFPYVALWARDKKILQANLNAIRKVATTILEELELEKYLPHSIPRDDLKRIADKYSWWAAKLAEAVCPHNDVACVEREARRLAEARRARLE